MSKAFTRERDDEGDDTAEDSSSDSFGPGDKNYMTPQGAKKLKDELLHLTQVERPKVTEVVAWAAGNGDRSENADYQYGKRRLREIDKRIRFLTKRIDALVVVDPTQLKGDQVFFGTTVDILTEDDVKKTYSIVGVDEIDIARGRISWKSPLGAALLKSRVGDTVSYRTPKGVLEVEVFAIRYVELT
jgi:transcription elongation factor GreB